MTIAVCLKCGGMKFGAWLPCPQCGHDPVTSKDRAKHLRLTDHYYSRQELEQFSERIKQGELLFEEEAPQPSAPCPYCGQPLRTTLAKQCRHCLTDWHDPANPQRLA